MSRVALDEGVPEQIAPCLKGHDVKSVRDPGLKGTKNGKLLDAIEALGFHAFISNDKKLQFDQNLSRRRYAVLLMSTNHWPTVKLHVGKIAAALATARPGSITSVDCGRFLRRPFRNAETPDV